MRVRPSTIALLVYLVLLMLPIYWMLNMSLRTNADILGAFALRNATFDVYLMLACGALGYLMKRRGYSPAAVVMGVILAPIADNELIRCFQLYGADWYMAFVERPIAAGILATLTAALAHGLWRRRRGPAGG